MLGAKIKIARQKENFFLFIFLPKIHLILREKIFISPNSANKALKK